MADAAISHESKIACIRYINQPPWMNAAIPLYGPAAKYEINPYLKYRTKSPTKTTAVSSSITK